MPDFKKYLESRSYSWKLNYERIYELAVMNYPFSFWQYNDSYCDDIPDPTASNKTLRIHLINHVDLIGFTNEYMQYYYPAVYQHLTEIGSVGFKTEHLAEYFDKVPIGSKSQNPYLESLAPDTSTIYHPEVSQDIYNWLVNKGNNIIYIYGENDALTACAIELTGETNALKLIQKGTNKNVKLNALDQKDLVLTTIEDWMGISNK
ncbi:hypothetical protein AKJ55_00480 [candidate division MSBL1 archaeon SCGC-AAA382M17]|uniref:Uncharacterized protein n=1 Tax=candidate division MSBL1 archaeon SCGC-AAA382M17 TaxID=1698284 RepID=A0ABR5TJX1_9EURY|nr:hypothetical protein AKJ55_00480 [candidate division MSBL1 archaeon SCGC-AAA382M17]